MPELPEVEAVRCGLEKTLVGYRVTDIAVFWTNIVQHDNLDYFKQTLIGQTCQSVKRRGKFLLMYFNTHVLISHLRMEGKYSICLSETSMDKHTHVIIELDKTHHLRYHDIRKFGRMILVPIGGEMTSPPLMKLGPEPTKHTLDVSDLTQYLSQKSTAIKNCLLDQSMVAGIGNIYADEILFSASIHPETSAYLLNDTEINRLYHAMIEIIDKAVQLGGSTIRSYVNAFGESGRYQDYHCVYGKTNIPCIRCHTPIHKIKVGGRGTHYCPTCQIKRVSQ